MKLSHAAALALVGWYLMRPPLPHLNAHAANTNTVASRSLWAVVKIFPTQKECEAHRANPWDQCTASDAPRLKEKIARQIVGPAADRSTRRWF
jgi:hypothetical protein